MGRHRCLGCHLCSYVKGSASATGEGPGICQMPDNPEGASPEVDPTPMEQERKPVVGEAREHRRKKVRRADVYWARKLESGHTQHAQRLIDERLEALTHPPLVDVPYLSGLDSDDGPYGSAQDATPDDSLPYEVTDSEEEGDDIVAYDTEDSHQTTVADRNRLRKRQRQ